MAESDSDRRHRLAVIATALGEEVAALSRKVDAQTEEIGDLSDELKAKNAKTSQKIKWIVALSILSLVLSGGLLVAFLKIADLIAIGELVRSDVSCPILSDLLGGYDPTTRAPGPARDLYEHNKALERHAYDVLLRCRTDLVPPRSDLVTTPQGPK